MARYGQRYKDRIVARLLPPESSAIDVVSREVGISVATLERWRADALADGSGERSGAGNQWWTAAARLQTVIAAMDEATLSAWCREQGLYPAEEAEFLGFSYGFRPGRSQHQDAWKQDAIAGLGEPRAASAAEAREDRLAGQGTGAATAPQGQGAGRNGRLAGAISGLPRRRGRMTSVEDRQILIRDIAQARVQGARLAPACALAGIDVRTLQRRKSNGGSSRGDRRPDADRPIPSHALSKTERAQIIAVASEPRFADTPPARIVPALADEGIHIASESSFHRVLRAHGQMNRRGRAQPPRTSRPPTSHIATRPAEVWCWDATFLPAQIQGRWFYRYLILDLCSHKIVGFEVHDTDSADHAAHLARRTALTEGIYAMPTRPVLYGDNGATLKATTVLAMLHWLGIKPSYSRPRVSDDNAFAEALFRTVKYRPEFPSKGFADLGAARQWTVRFVQWYNDEHRHSAIRYVTPAQRHTGQDRPLLEARHAVYQDARERNPKRWSRKTRNRTPITVVTLNPERDTLVQAASSPIQLSWIGTPAFPPRPGNASPRRAAQGMGGAEPPAATRSIASMASTGPSPK